MPARQVAEVRGIAEQRPHATVAKATCRADPALPGDLVATLKTPEGKRHSELERIRRPPTRTTGTAMKDALQRVDDITVHLDAGYDSGRTRTTLGQRGPRGRIAHKGEEAPIQAAQRRRAERTRA